MGADRGIVHVRPPGAARAGGVGRCQARELGGAVSVWSSPALAASRASPRSARRESTTTRPPPSTTAAIGTGSLVRRTAVVAAIITADHDVTDVAKGTVARFHGSSASGMIVKTWSPGLFKNQPPVNPASKMGERVDGSAARQARATPTPRTTAPGRTFMAAPPRRSSRAEPLKGNDPSAHRLALNGVNPTFLEMRSVRGCGPDMQRGRASRPMPGHTQRGSEVVAPTPTEAGESPQKTIVVRRCCSRLQRRRLGRLGRRPPRSWSRHWTV